MRLPERLLRAAGAMALAGATVAWAAPPLTGALVPAITFLADLASPQLVTGVALVGEGVRSAIEADAVLLAGARVGADGYVAPATRIGPFRFSLANTVAPLAALFALLALQPVAGGAERLRRWALGALAAALLVVASAALHLAGLIDMALVDAAPPGLADHPPWTVHALVVLESGGRWLAAAVLALACIAAARGRG
jgi:hypothetical protein